MDKAAQYTSYHRYCKAPYCFPMEETDWQSSLYEDTDSDGRTLFAQLKTLSNPHGLIQYGRTALGFDPSGEISEAIHYPVIRFLHFDPSHPEAGEELLDTAMRELGDGQRIYAFFHYFGMSGCARHGKLHESEPHVEALLLEKGFTVEHENVYYSRELTGPLASPAQLQWKPISPGGCREFAVSLDGNEFCWGQVHFLPQRQIAYLRWIFVDTQRQHQGLGTKAMETLFSTLYQMGIRRFDTDTALDNRIAQRYYEKNGFQNEGITRSYYTK